MKYFFIVFKKQKGEIVNAYSIVDENTLTTIPQKIIRAKIEVKDKLYTTQELEAMRDKLL